MGLDQYAFINPREEKRTNDEGKEYTVKLAEKDFYWRKHSRLQTFMEKRWVEKTGKDAVELNCKDMELNREDIIALVKAVNNGYADDFCEGGFYYGHQFQEQIVQEEKTTDLHFCEEALQAIDDGHKVVYSCWW